MKGKSAKSALILVSLVLLASTGVTIMVFTGASNDTIRIAYSNKVDYEPLILASDLDLYEGRGVKVDEYTVTGGIQAAEALATGSVDLAGMGDSPALLLLSQNPDMRIVGRYGGGEGMHRTIAWNDVESPADLVGKKVGIQFGSSTHGAFLSWASSKGLNLSQVTLVPLSPTDMPEAMATRQIDAMSGSEPWPTNVENACGDQVHELGDSSGLNNSFPLVLVTSTDVIDNRPHLLQSVLDSIAQAVDLINEGREWAAGVCCSYTGLSASDQLRCMEPLFYDLGFNQTDRDSLELTASFLVEYGKIDGVPDLDEGLDLRFVEPTTGLLDLRFEVEACPRE